MASDGRPPPFHICAKTVPPSTLSPNESQLLLDHGFRHAFFTRHGGVSEGPYASLNFSYAVGDLSARVDENFRLAALHLEVLPTHVCFLSQVHGDTCVEACPSTTTTGLMGSEGTGSTQPRHKLAEGDALCSSDPTIACAIRTADCLPILLGDLRTGRVAAAHAGWRGLVNGVIRSAVNQLGGNPKDYVAAIGPHIETAAFEVSDDVADALRQVSPGGDPVRTDGYAKPHVDLRLVAECQLRALGLPSQHIQQVLGCTFAEPALYFSFRRDGQFSGRLLSAICART
jgi:polyphenol oxidase